MTNPTHERATPGELGQLSPLPEDAFGILPPEVTCQILYQSLATGRSVDEVTREVTEVDPARIVAATEELETDASPHEEPPEEHLAESLRGTFPASDPLPTWAGPPKTFH